MQWTLKAATILAALSLTPAASAQTHAVTIYCLVSGGDAGARNCSYHTVDCNSARVGAGGTCVAYTVQR